MKSKALNRFVVIVVLALTMLAIFTMLFQPSCLKAAAQTTVTTEEQAEREGYPYLDLDIADSKFGAWIIEVINPYDFDITFKYNGKMCFDEDAKNWSGLEDLVTTTVNANTSTEIFVNTNWFATTVVVGWVYENKLLITYANNLSDGGLDFYQTWMSAPPNFYD